MEAGDQASQKQYKGVRHDFLQRYLTAAEWATLKSDQADMTTKLRCVTNRCKLIGLKNATELTAVRMAGIVALAQHVGPPILCRPDPIQLLVLLWVSFKSLQFSELR